MEQNGSTQIVYAPTGQKFALMTGQTVSKAFVPLPAGAQAVYAGTTLAYFRHPDWLGSSRLSTTPSRTVYSSLAYAPFGETYAESGTPDRSFTGQNQDTIPGSTAGLYDFLFRQHAQYGRWTSPDPAGSDAVSVASPQSWNRYAYAGNNPLNTVDPSGLDWCLVGTGGVCEQESFITDASAAGMIQAGLDPSALGYTYVVPVTSSAPAPTDSQGSLTMDTGTSAAWGSGSAFSGLSGWTPDRSGPGTAQGATTSQPQPPQAEQQCVQGAKSPEDPLTKGSSTVAFINNPITHLLDDVVLMGGGAVGISGTVAFNIYAFGQTGGAATPLLVMADPALVYGSLQMMKTGYNKFKSDLNEFKNTLDSLRKPGC